MKTDTHLNYQLFQHTLQPREFALLLPDAKEITLHRVESYLFDSSFDRQWKQTLICLLGNLELVLQLDDENISSIIRIQQILERWEDDPL